MRGGGHGEQERSGDRKMEWGVLGKMTGIRDISGMSWKVQEKFPLICEGDSVRLQLREIEPEPAISWDQESLQTATQPYNL